ncbi:MAG: hypothetical protein ACT4PL_00595 [Phycisphaerales bacterium]
MLQSRTRSRCTQLLPETVLAVVVGALLLVGVCTVLSVTTDEPLLSVGVPEIPAATLPGSVPPPFDQERNIVWGVHRSWCRTLEIYRVGDNGGGRMSPATSGAELVYEVHTIGWPFPAMRRDFIFGRGVGGVWVGSPETAGLTERGFVEKGLLGGAPAAVAGGLAKEKPRYFIPIRPDPLGWALNLPIYALAAWLLIFFARRLAARLRALRGGCAGCGYALGPLTTCPECGHRRAGAAAPAPSGGGA